MALLILCGFGMAAPVSAGADESHIEGWPEVQLFYHFNPRTLLLINSSPNRSVESGEKTNADYGVYFNYMPRPHIAYRIGYSYSVDQAARPGEHETVEHKIVLDYSYGWPIGRRCLLWDRIRIDLRDRDGTASQRFRNRVRFQRNSRIGRMPALVFMDAELFYDTRFAAVARYKFQLGANFSVSPRVELTPYLGWQVDTQPANAATTGFGLVFGVHF